MKNICVIGTGYVGLPTAACFADLGNRVVTVDIDERKVEKLKRGEMPIYEPGLEELVERNVKSGRLSFTTSYDEGLENADFVFICVGTPSAVDGEADLKYVRAAAQTIAEKMKAPLIVVNKSTVPVGTGDWTTDIIQRAQPHPIDFAVVSCPEFLREGSAITDFMMPDRTVLGSVNRQAAESVAELYAPLKAPTVITDLRTAEMIKYASNAFLATKISFINEISIICERLGADVTEVARGMGFDKRIGEKFLQAGVGYGGSCFTADETIFALNSPNVIAERIEDYFDKVSAPEIEGDVVTVKVPEGKRVLGFDLTTGKPTLSDVRAITRRPYTGVMVTIQTSMGRELTVTGDHPVIVFSSDSQNPFRIIPAVDVAPGDQVTALMQLPEMVSPTGYNELIVDALKGAKVTSGLGVTLIAVTTVSKKRLDELVIAFQRLGVIPKVKIAVTTGSGENLYSLEIAEHNHSIVLNALLDSVQSGASYPLNRLEKHTSSYTILTVQEVSYQFVNTHVYSLETSTETVIGSSGLINHNCFPKDVKALANMALTHGMHPQLLNAVMEINDFQRKHIILKVRDLVGGNLEGKVIAVLGLAFKENTDDTRESPALTVVRSLMNQGASVRAYDPMAMENVASELKGVVLCETPYEVAENADVIVMLTPWNEFKQLDMGRIRQSMKTPIMVDGRNMYDPETMRKHGFVYRGVGRGFNGEGTAE